MTPIRMGRATVNAVSSEELATRTSALSLALHTGSDQLDPDSVVRARRAVDKAEERMTIAGDHTVVALAGATGSGKSSLFNAIVGEDVAAIGARRPTTSRPTAAVFGSDDAGPLLDWLQVDARHVVAETTDEEIAGTLDGLVLLDLPDFDSRVLSHRVEAERILELVDIFVWVTDPQKYADARLHDEFVSVLSHHGAVTLAVLNQADRLTPEGVEACSTDLRQLLAADGIADATVLPVSALTGDGLVDLRQRLANAVATRAAARQRLSADVVTVAAQLRKDVADSEVDVQSLPRNDLDQALARAAGVPIVLDAVARDYRREAFVYTGWIFARWTRGFAADPLRRLRLDTGSRPPIPVEIEGADVRAVLGRSSIPAPSASTRSAVDLATREFVRDAAEGLPLRWAQTVEEAVTREEGSLADALDQAVMHTPLRARRPVWWFVLNVLQWALGLTAITGLVWLVVLYVLGFLQLPAPETPRVGILPLPLVMLVGGLVLGLVLGLLARWWSKAGARRRKVLIARRLRTSVAEVTDARVLAPIAEVLGRHAQTRRHLDEARG
ncbi:MAG TPA: GTPase [Dermatophilaceae bacterium]|nr:GTPase [Dermatophilaceae bacterium]